MAIAVEKPTMVEALEILLQAKTLEYALKGEGQTRLYVPWVSPFGLALEVKYDLYEDGGGAIVGFDLYCQQCFRPYLKDYEKRPHGSCHTVAPADHLRIGLFGGRERLEMWVRDWLTHLNPELDTLQLLLRSEDIWYELEAGLEYALIAAPRS